MRYLTSALLKLKLSLVLLFAVTACGGGSGNEGSDSSPTPQSAPVIESFTADPGYLLAGAGSDALLLWEVSGASRLSISPGVGAVTGNTGSTSVQPPDSTMYTLLAENDHGSMTASVTIVVGTMEPGGKDAYGVIPAGLPWRLSVGLVEDPGDTWMRDSGVAWDIRYRYFTKGWRNNWGWDPENNGSWGWRWMDECHSHGFIPAIQYYCMNE